MNLPNLLFTILLFTAASVSAQNIKVKPYLQDAAPHSIFILWETDTADESIVEWGLTESLGNTTTGTAAPSVGDARIHEVKLENLERFTRYFYRVKTGAALSDIYSFKTPPFAADRESFRMIAMSDMQRDNNLPNKYYEVVHDGILDYLNDEFGGDLTDNLALVLIPGDLVQNGNDFASWEETFFQPSEDLFNQVPVYPVPGNHENNSDYFFQYFKLPENGTPGFSEHWWYKDYGRVRIIGLDSNGPYQNQEQLDWLEEVLEAACVSDSIDFVFAQLHHPHKSELWTPGEIDYTGEVIQRLELFTTDCAKPSIHFFGHTHAYSRGNSRDHKHLWINAATAGGAIDNWGEFPNFDYDEFSVSHDEYGFVAVEITADADPKIVIKRITRGDQSVIIDNQVTDSLTIRLKPSLVDTPVPLFPIEEAIAPECVQLIASEFSAPDPLALHGQSHWQVSADGNDFSQVVGESWKNFENWYFDEDTQAGDDLSDEYIGGLSENTNYWWRVRYRDRELNWSEWSDPVAFSTSTSLAPPNLLINAGAEDSLANWTIVEGVVEALTAGVCNGIIPHSGERYFAVGGLCEHSPVARCIQNIDVSAQADSIDTGQFTVHFGGYLSNFGGQDLPEMRLVFLDQNNFELDVSSTLSTLNNSWTLLSERLPIPSQTRTIRMELKGTRNAGTDNDSYFDDLFLSLGAGSYDCSIVTDLSHQTAFPPLPLTVTPNPVTAKAFIDLPTTTLTNPRLYLVDSTGSKVRTPIEYFSDRIFFNKGNLPPGTYFFWVKNAGQVIGRGNFVVAE